MEKEAYQVTRYDNVYIVLKGYNEAWKDRIKFSANRKKYFLRGRIIEWLITSPDGQHVVRSYPLSGAVSFVDHRDWQMFSTSKWDKAKEGLIKQIHYTWIKEIILDFDSFDWKK